MPRLTKSQIIGPFEFEIPGLGRVSLKTAGIEVSNNALKRSSHEAEDEAAAAFTNTLISAMLVDPQRTEEQIASLDETSLAALCEAAAQANHYKDEWSKTPVDLLPRTRLYRAHLANERAREEAYRARASQMKSLIEHHGNSELMRSISTLDNIQISTGALDAAQQLSRAYANLWGSSTPPIAIQAALASLNQLQSSGLRSYMLEALEQNRRFQETFLARDNQSLLATAKVALNLIPPEPFFSDALINLHLNTPEIHLPSHRPLSPSPEPIETVEEWEDRVEDAELKRIQDAQSIISKLEWEIRKLIQARLRALYGDEWWERGVQPKIRMRIEEEKKKKQKADDVDRHPIYYAHFDDYRSIIKKNENWSRVFCKIFVKNHEFETMFDWLCAIRPPVQHTRPISQEDFMRLTIAGVWFHESVQGHDLD